jgi:hypothetical protein
VVCQVTHKAAPVWCVDSLCGVHAVRCHPFMSLVRHDFERTSYILTPHLLVLQVCPAVRSRADHVQRGGTPDRCSPKSCTVSVASTHSCGTAGRLKCGSRCCSKSMHLPSCLGTLPPIMWRFPTIATGSHPLFRSLQALQLRVSLPPNQTAVTWHGRCPQHQALQPHC